MEKVNLNRIIKEEIEKVIKENLTDDVKEYTLSLPEDLENINIDDIEGSLKAINNILMKTRRINVFFKKKMNIETSNMVNPYRMRKVIKEVLQNIITTLSAYHSSTKNSISNLSDPSSREYVPSIFRIPLFLKISATLGIGEGEIQKIIDGSTTRDKKLTYETFLTYKEFLSNKIDEYIELVEEHTEEIEDNLNEAQDVGIIKILNNNPLAKQLYSELIKSGVEHFKIFNAFKKVF